jgi:hypothetical protein
MKFPEIPELSLGLLQHALKGRWTMPDDVRARAAAAVAHLIRDPTAGRRAEVVARLLGVGVSASS